MIGMECYQDYGALPLPAKNNLNDLENSGGLMFRFFTLINQDGRFIHCGLCRRGT